MTRSGLCRAELVKSVWGHEEQKRRTECKTERFKLPKLHTAIPVDEILAVSANSVGFTMRPGVGRMTNWSDDIGGAG